MNTIQADKNINEYLNTEWTFVDFFYAYCQARGIEDPENDLTDEEYSRMEEECAKKIDRGMLRNLRDVMIQDMNERILMAMGG